MKASLLIAKLNKLITSHGDLDVIEPELLGPITDVVYVKPETDDNGQETFPEVFYVV